VLRKFGPKREEGPGGCRRMKTEDIHNLYPSTYISVVIKSRNMRWAAHVARIQATRNAYYILVGRPRRKWKDREIGCNDVDWIHLE
jgi:hypothetical protein